MGRGNFPSIFLFILLKKDLKFFPLGNQKKFFKFFQGVAFFKILGGGPIGVFGPKKLGPQKQPPIKILVLGVFSGGGLVTERKFGIFKLWGAGGKIFFWGPIKKSLFFLKPFP